MPISILCDGCGQKLKAKESMAGRTVPCPQCQTPLQIPDAESDVDLPDDQVHSFSTSAPKSNRPSDDSEDDQHDDEYRLAGQSDTKPQGSGSVFTSLTSTESSPDPANSFDAEFGGPSSSPAARPKPKRRVRRAPEPDDVDDVDEFSDTRFGAGGIDPGRYLYLLIGVTMLPLAVHLLAGPDDTEARLTRTLQKHQIPLTETASKESVLSQLPDGKIEGALLPYDSYLHWGMGAVAIIVFLGASVGLLPRSETHPGRVVAAGLFTGTVGLLFLTVVQFLAEMSMGIRHIRGRGAILLVILWLIAFSYRAALDPTMSFIPSLLGFMFGVGLCEELTKALPIIYAQRHYNHDWRSACVWGFASGAGFGIAEGIHYAGDQYNGLQPLSIYLVRFVSCVGLHAMWSAVIGVLYWRCADEFDDDIEWTMAWPLFYKVLVVPMTLHALYDTLLKKDMQIGALSVAAVTFVTLIATIEWTTAGERAQE